MEKDEINIDHILDLFEEMTADTYTLCIKTKKGRGILRFNGTKNTELVCFLKEALAYSISTSLEKKYLTYKHTPKNSNPVCNRYLWEQTDKKNQ